MQPWPGTGRGPRDFSKDPGAPPERGPSRMLVRVLAPALQGIDPLRGEAEMPLEKLFQNIHGFCSTVTAQSPWY